MAIDTTLVAWVARHVLPAEPGLRRWLARAFPGCDVAQSRSFDVVWQSAATGIVAFARQAGIQIIAPEDATRGRRTPAVRGTMAVADGLRRLTATAGLRLVSFDGRTAVLAAGTMSPRLETRARAGVTNKGVCTACHYREPV